MVCIHVRSRDTGFIQYFYAFDYLHFVRISHEKFIASRFPATALNVLYVGLAFKIVNEEETGLNTVVYAKGRMKKENKHIKYHLTLYFGTFD